MKKLLFTLSFLYSIGFAFSQDNIRISGRVTDGQNPLPNVKVFVEGSDSEIYTDNQGRYTINTTAQSTLVYSFMGMETVEYITEDLSSVVNIEMRPDVQKLDEVVVTRRRKSQKDLAREYTTNKNLIWTSFGIIDKERATHSIKIIDGDDLSFAGIDFIGALVGLVPGMRVYRPNGISRTNNRYGTDPTKPIVLLPRTFMSFQNQRPVAYEVDGQLMADAPTEIQVFNIKRIAVMGSALSTAKYGQFAAGGIIIINTRGGTFDARAQYEASFDQARSWDNVFEERLVKLNRIPRTKAIQKLYETASLEEANALIEEEDLLSSVTVYNQMEIADYFYSQLGQQERYLELMHALGQKYSNNAVILKSIAFQYDKHGFDAEALELYQRIFKIRPSYPQSYRDLANVYQRIGDTEKSLSYLSRYIRYVSLDTLSTAAVGIDSTIFTEYDNLLSKSGIERYDSRISNPGSLGNMRLLIEWSHGDAEFELQFVNPTKRYFTWQHSLADTPERIKDEKLKGYSSEQFFIDETMAGKWQVNMKYLGNKSYDPTFLKLSVFYNYGTRFERVETYVHKLTEKNVNYNLLSFINNPIRSAAAR